MVSKWQLIYYTDPKGTNPVSEFLDKLTPDQQSKLLRIFHNIQEYGLDSVIPHIKKLSGTPFWEIRILGRDNIRVVYIVPAKNQILALHGFIKKKQKTPAKELQIALERYKAWMDRMSRLRNIGNTLEVELLPQEVIKTDETG